jgi:hypothetical protein
MAIKQKSTKKLKREAVVPFAGEENFIVPKKGGFAQPDMEGYVMVAGTSIVASDTPTSSSSDSQTTATQTAPAPATTTTAPSTATPPTEVVTQPRVAQAPTTVTGTPQQQVVSDTPVESPRTTNVAVSNTNVVSSLPTFPVWDTLDCASLDSEILRLKNLMAVSRFTQNIMDAYNNEITKATAVKTIKCTTTNAVIVPMGGGFGGGGGIGEHPINEQPKTEEEAKGSSKKTLLVVLGIVGLLYLLTKKRSS